MSKKTFIFLVSGLIIALGFFVVQAAGPSLESSKNLTVPAASTIIFQGTTPTSINWSSYGGYSLTAGTATYAGSLVANPSNCSAGSYPLGIAANGSVESCTTLPSGSDAWTVNGTTVYKTNTAGNVGIGTTGPLWKLQVLASTETFNAGGNFENVGGATPTRFAHDSPGVVWTYPTAMIRRDSSATTLTDTPIGLALYNADTTTGAYSVMSFASREPSGGNSVSLAGIGAQNRGSIYGAWGSGDLVFWTKNYAPLSEVMRLTAGGNVGIGTTGPLAKLEIRGSGTYNGDTYTPIPTTDAVIYSSEMTDNNYHSMLQLLSVRQSLSTGAGANGYLGFSTKDDSNGEGIVDAGRIAIVNESGSSRNSATALSFWTNTGGIYSNAGTERMRITSSGNVGIGTTGPTANGLTIYRDGGDRKVLLELNRPNTAGLQTAIEFTVGGSIMVGRIQHEYVAANHNDMSFTLRSPGGADIIPLWLDNSGNVGIGTTAPAITLAVGGDSSFGISGVSSATPPTGLGYGMFPYSGIGLGFYSGAQGATQGIGFWTKNGAASPAETVRILSNGNVGIGTTAPGSKLTNQTGNIGNADGLTAGAPAFQWQVGAQGYAGVFSNTGGGGQFADGLLVKTIGTSNTVDAIIDLESGGVNRVRVTGAGNVGIGTTGPNKKLHVTDDVWTDTSFQVLDRGADYYMIQAGSGATEYPIGLRFQGSPDTLSLDNGYGDIQLIPGISGTLNGSSAIVTVKQTTGNVGIGTTAPGVKLDVNGDVRATSFIYSSDRALKKNIAAIKSPLEKILQLRGVTFNWKKDNTPGVGLIAQEVEKVFPELVGGQEGSKAVAYGNLVAPLIEAIKEQQRKIDQLETRITILEMAR